MKRSAGPSTRRVLPRLLRAPLFAAALSAAVSAPGGALAPAAVPRLQADERARSFAKAEAAGGLDWEGLEELALWASGASASSAAGARARIAAAAADLRAETGSAPGDPASVRARAERVLLFMHRRFLTGYAERQTRLDTLVETGRYNCVSSAALYAVLAAAVGLTVDGVATVDHAFVSIRAGDEPIDVETTSPYGFDPGNRIEFQDEFGRTTGFAYVSPRNYRQRTSISRLELVSLILSNRIVELEGAGRYAEAVGLALDRRELLSIEGSGTAAATAGSAAKAGTAAAPASGSPRAEAELLDRMLNYGTSLARAGKEAEALAWAAEAEGVSGPHPRWDEFTAAVANNLLAKLVRAGRTAEARGELLRLQPLLGAEAKRNLDALVTDAELVAAIGAATGAATEPSAVATTGAAIGAATGAAVDAAVALVAAAVRRGAVTAERGRELTVYARLKAAERAARAEGWKAAIAAVEDAIASDGRDRKLEDALRVYRANRVSELHNAFAVLYNAGRYAEAREAARAALAEYPEDRRLRADLDTAERALSRRP